VATLKPTLRIELSPQFRAAVRLLPKQQRSEIGRAITAVRDGFGAPHQHSGLGLRRLRESVFECRVGLKLRLVFESERGLLSFTAIGTHDEVQKLLKNR
jgi:mRNA-degrading endonuclease YafQ of YafQ-DinJ toxin-antitoxin module